MTLFVAAVSFVAGGCFGFMLAAVLVMSDNEEDL